MNSSLPELEDRFEDLSRFREAYETLQTLTGEYENESLEETTEVFDDLLSEEPTYSVTMLLRQADRELEEIQKAEDNIDYSTDISYIRNIISEQLSGYPAVGTGRHYSLEERQKNL